MNIPDFVIENIEHLNSPFDQGLLYTAVIYYIRNEKDMDISDYPPTVQCVYNLIREELKKVMRRRHNARIYRAKRKEKMKNNNQKTSQSLDINYLMMSPAGHFISTEIDKMMKKLNIHPIFKPSYPSPNLKIHPLLHPHRYKVAG